MSRLEELLAKSIITEAEKVSDHLELHRDNNTAIIRVPTNDSDIPAMTQAIRQAGGQLDPLREQRYLLDCGEHNASGTVPTDAIKAAFSAIQAAARPASSIMIIGAEEPLQAALREAKLHKRILIGGEPVNVRMTSADSGPAMQGTWWRDGKISLS